MQIESANISALLNDHDGRLNKIEKDRIVQPHSIYELSEYQSFINLGQ